MRNRSKRIVELAEKLPVFTFDDFSGVEKNRDYLCLVLHRCVKSGLFLRLKKGVYTTSLYAEKMKNRGEMDVFLNFLSGFLYSPSYLSLETILYRHNLLTEIPQNFTSVTRNKTAAFTNKLGRFFYHKIKDELFCGFKIVGKNEFSIFEATPAKALFDFLYLRRNFLNSKGAFKGLRINAENLTKSDLREIEKYVKIFGLEKMKKISGYLKASR